MFVTSGVTDGGRGGQGVNAPLEVEMSPLRMLSKQVKNLEIFSIYKFVSC